MESGRSILNTWFERVWCDESDSAITEMFRPSGRATGLGADALQGPADFKMFRDAMLGLVSDVKIVIEDHFENETMNAAICKLTATCRETGKSVTMDGCCYYAAADGIITHCDNYWNFIEFFEQLGCLDSGTFAVALQGRERQE